MAMNEVDLLTLQVADLDKMRTEFPEIYETLYTEGNLSYKKHLKIKKKAIRHCIAELQ
jgi:hypothetical protein